MEIRNRMLFIGAPISSLGLALFVAVSPAQAGSRYLCTSIPKACQYAGPAAPVLGAEVCWNGNTAKLKTSLVCPSGSWPYWVEYGTVDPLTRVVQAYIALDDACELGWCLQLTAGTQLPDEDGEICCESDVGSGPCTLEVLDCTGNIVWCESYETNADGTVQCVEVEE